MGVLPVVEVDPARALGGRLLGADPGLVRKLGMLLVGMDLVDVIVADDVDHRGDAAPAAAVGHGGTPRRVEPPGEGLHRRGDARALDVALDGPFLVAERPEDHAGMVAVAQDHALELVQLRRTRAHQAVLVEDEHPEAVARVEQLGRRAGCGSSGRRCSPVSFRRAMRNSCSASGHRDAHARRSPGGCSSPLHFDMPAVQEEPAVRDRSGPCGCRRGSRMRSTTAPPVRMVVTSVCRAGASSDQSRGCSTLSTQENSPAAAGGERRASARSRDGHNPPSASTILCSMSKVASARPLVGDRCARGDLRRIPLNRGCHKGAPVRDVQRRRLGQPDVPVDSRPLVEPSLLHRGVDPDGNRVVAPVIQVVGQVVAEARVAARLAPEVEAVDPDDRVAEDAVKLDADPPAEVGGRDGERLPIPADTAFGKFAADGLVAVARAGACGKRRLNRPVVRQIEEPPCSVVEFRRGRPVPVARLGEIREIAGSMLEILRRVKGVAEGEPPVAVEEGALAWARIVRWLRA